ncbi:MAG: hypothetical protein ACJAVN_000571 [Roseivirga sp.]|jgi:hypothetical protein
MRGVRLIFSIVVLCLLYISALKAQVVDNEFVRGGIAISDLGQSQNSHYLITVKADELESFNDLNKPYILKRFSPHTFLVNALFLVNPKQILHVFEVNDYWKLGLKLRQDEQLRETTYLIKTSNFGLTRHKLGSFKNVIQNELNDASNLLSIVSDASAIASIVSWPEVEYVQVLSKASEEANTLSHDLSVNSLNWLHHNRPSLTGSGINLAMKEMTYDPEDVDIWPRVVKTDLEHPVISAHANSMASIAAGAGNTSTLSRGAAFQASLTSSSFNRVLPDDEDYFQEYDITIQNHSYGLGIVNEYDAVASAYDNLTNMNRELLHVFSSGNSGFLVPDNGRYSGLGTFANITGALKMAKNILTVGAIDKLGNLNARSSVGPAYDGRVKPELMAYGPGGTSEAAALVSGTSVLLKQAFEDRYFTSPTSAQLKAILIGSSKPLIESEQISYSSGYGRLNAKRALEIVENNQLFKGEIMSDGNVTHEIVLPEGVKNLRVVLVWNDPAANPGDFMALVNDLDMTVTKGANTAQWLPWVLDPTADIEKLVLPPIRKVDSLNNIELITVENPDQGIYTIQLSADGLIGESQVYEIAYSYDFENDFQWTYPTGSDVVNVDESFIARFENTYETTGELYMKYRDSDWVKLDDIDDSSLIEIYSFENLGIAQLRVDFGNSTYLSDEFIVSTSVDINKQFLCEDDFLLSWSAVEIAERYGVYRINESGNLEQVLSTTDTAVFLNKNDQVWNFDLLTIIPFVDGKMGEQAQVFNFANDGVGCYYNNFRGVVTEGSVTLDLDLSTAFNIKSISFDKWNGSTFQAIYEEDFAGDLSFIFEDANTNSGYFTYRASIKLVTPLGGLESSMTDLIELPVILPSTISLFPNPLNIGEDLNLLSANPNAKWLLFIDSQGNRSKVIEIISTKDSFTIEGIGSGLYLYQILDETRKIIETGRIIIQ